MEIDMLFDKDFTEKKHEKGEPCVILTLAELFDLMGMAEQLGKESADKKRVPVGKTVKGRVKVKVKDKDKADLRHKRLGELSDEQLARVVIRGGNGRVYGVPGKATPYKDCNGEKLYVGDVVIVDMKQKKGWDCTYPLTLVVDDGRKLFVDGIEVWCDEENGSIHNEARVRKVKGWAETEVGDVYKSGELTIGTK